MGEGGDGCPSRLRLPGALGTARPTIRFYRTVTPSRFAFRLAKRGSRFCLDNLKTNEHFPKIIQLDDSLLLYGMQ